MVKPRCHDEAFLCTTRENWTVHGEKGQTTVRLSIPRMDAGSSFMVDITLIMIWTKHCKAAKKLPHCYDSIRAFKLMLTSVGDTTTTAAHFPCLKDILHQELMLTWLGTKIRSQDCCTSLGDCFRSEPPTHFISFSCQVTPNWHPSLRTFSPCLWQPIFVNKFSLWWASVKQSCVQDSHTQALEWHPEIGYSGYDAWYWCTCEG